VELDFSPQMEKTNVLNVEKMSQWLQLIMDVVADTVTTKFYFPKSSNIFTHNKFHKTQF
jgi:hypothetical protein|tara:strand:- start:82 stop:258 length:177 start_codon:yes stop_codon:yes gene_type:complete